MLVQTPLNFVSEKSISFEYKYNGITENVKSTTDNITYPPLTVKIPNGSEYNPTFIKFTYLGESFTV